MGESRRNDFGVYLTRWAQTRKTWFSWRWTRFWEAFIWSSCSWQPGGRKGWNSPAFWLMVYALVGLVLHLLLRRRPKRLAGVDGFRHSTRARRGSLWPRAETGRLAWMDFVNRLRFDQSGAVLLAFLLFMGLRASLPPLPPKARRNEASSFAPLPAPAWTTQLAWLGGGLLVSAGALASQNYTLIFFVWLLFAGMSVLSLARSFQAARQPLLRSRIFFWSPALLLAIANELILFYQWSQVEGDFLRVLALIAMSYAVLVHHLPDVQDFLRQLLIYLLSSLLIVLVYLGLFWLADLAPARRAGLFPSAGGRAVTALLSLLFTPIFGWVSNLVNRLFRIESYAPSKTLREYALSISNILDLERLATVAVGLIMEALEIKRGMLFLVDPELGEGNKTVFRLREVWPHNVAASAESSTAPSQGTSRRKKGHSIVLAEDSPISAYFREQHLPLLQEDIDFSPEFMETSLAERKWFSELGLQAYAPIFSRGEWIGLLALGPKPRRYTPDDLNFLSAIASQDRQWRSKTPVWSTTRRNSPPSSREAYALPGQSQPRPGKTGDDQVQLHQHRFARVAHPADLHQGLY